VAMTITGCAKQQKMISLLKPAIVLIEEAAEVLESQTISVLNPDLQHLILIGVRSYFGSFIKGLEGLGKNKGNLI
jgi:hypothetical protein